jgi:tRNA(Ile)-lysidine synthase
MEQNFKNYIESNQLCLPTDRILLGVSGGVDSVCMFHLFRQLNYAIAIAHCNFQLRNSESDLDEEFVQDLAEQFDIPFFSKRFNTQEVSEREGISIQMAARDLRYEWFEEIRDTYNYNHIAIAHNSDDVVETFLINLSRGSGIKGFSGIKSKSGKIIRPLLFASRNEIESFITENNYSYREDSSNQTTKYSRNLLRHEIIPLFEKINPNFRNTVIENISKLKDAEEIYLRHIANIKDSLIRNKDGYSLISIEKLSELKPLETILFEMIKPYGFSLSQVKDIIKSFNSIPGKQFYSATHRIIRDREDLIIEELSSIHTSNYYIDTETDFIENPLKLKRTTTQIDDDFEINKSRNIGYFDLDNLEFPLVLRKWEKGDYFMPLGMNNLKKLSDFFIDNKLSIAEKEKVWILESLNKIIWVIGYRIDERFKVNSNTKNVLKIEIVE